MNDEEQKFDNETDENISKLSKAKKQSAYAQMAAAILSLGVIVVVLAAFHAQSQTIDSLRGALEHRQNRVATLEEALDTQRQQFLDCIGADSRDEYCIKPVSPRSDSLPGAPGPAGPAGPQGDKGDKGDKGDPGADGQDYTPVVPTEPEP